MVKNAKKTNKRTAKTKTAPKKTVAKKPKTAKKAIDKRNRDEFRVNKDSGHPTYIYQKVGNEYKYIGITHSRITRGSKNIELEKNSNPKDKTTAYIKSSPQKAKTKRFKDKKTGWGFSKNDRKKVEKVKRRGK